MFVLWSLFCMISFGVCKLQFDLAERRVNRNALRMMKNSSRVFLLLSCYVVPTDESAHAHTSCWIEDGDGLVNNENISNILHLRRMLVTKIMFLLWYVLCHHIMVVSQSGGELHFSKSGNVSSPQGESPPFLNPRVLLTRGTMFHEA
jgi:hypothetical protein